MRRLSLPLAILLALGPALFVRLPFILYHRLPIPFPDSATYLWPLQAVEERMWPLFDLRTPGYPLFWWICRRISHEVLFVVSAQIGLSWLVVVGALALLKRHAPEYLWPAAAAAAMFLSGNGQLMADITLLSESVFATCVIAWSLSVFLTVRTFDARYAAAASVAAAAAILVRPSSLGLCVLQLALAAYVLARSKGWSTAAWLVSPLAVVLAMLVAYNALTIGVVGLSAGSTWARLWSTTVYLDPDPRLPSAINEAIAAKNRALSDEDKALIYAGQPLGRFRQALEKNIGVGIGLIADRVTGWPAPTESRYMEHREMLNGVVATAIAQHPRLFVRNAIGSFLDYFAAIGAPHGNVYRLFPPEKLFTDAFVSPPFYVLNLAGYYHPSAPRAFTIARGVDGSVEVKRPARRLEDWYASFSTWRSVVLENWLWIGVLPAAALAALTRFWRSRSDYAFAVLIIIANVVGNAAASAFIGHFEQRYAQPLYFVNYFCAALAISLIARFFQRGLRTTSG